MELRINTLLSDGVPAILPSHDAQEIAWHRAELRKRFDGDYPVPALAGDGIVTCSFGPKYALMTQILRRTIRETGCKLPMQIWSDGHLLEFDDALTTIVPTPRRNFPFWQYSWKSHAVLHSGFRRCLWLDCDTQACIDPAELFVELDRYPCVFWSREAPQVRSYFEHYTGITKEPICWETNGGHCLWDVAAAYKELSVMAWVDAHGDYFYCYQVFHDEATLIMALSELGTNYLRLPRQAVGWASVCYWRQRPCIVHRLGQAASSGRTACPTGTCGYPAKNASSKFTGN